MKSALGMEKEVARVGLLLSTVGYMLVNRFRNDGQLSHSANTTMKFSLSKTRATSKKNLIITIPLDERQTKTWLDILKRTGGK
jgi:hypothetical protein